MTVMDMDDTTMTVEDFEERAMAYGADIDCWPPEDRGAARSLLARSPEAREAVADARLLDEMLDLWKGPEPSHALLSRVLADAATVTAEAGTGRAAPARPTGRDRLARLFGERRLLRPGVVLAACLALGFAMGTGIEEDILDPAGASQIEEIDVIDFAFAMEDDIDLLLGPEAL